MRGEVKVYQRKIVVKKRRRAFYYTFYSLALATVIVVGLSYLSRIDSLAIKDVEVRGVERFPASGIQSLVWNGLSGNYEGLFSKDNSLIYPKGSIEDSLRAEPYLKSARIAREGLQKLVAEVSERKEAAVWCGKGSEEALCYSVDDSGFVFAPALEKASTSPSFVYRGAMAEEPIGKNFIPEADFKKIQFFIRELAGLSVDPREAALEADGTMSVLLGKGAKIVVNTKDDLSTVLNNISAVLADKQVAPDLSRFLEELDYIKFDSGNKVVYKMRK